MQNNTDWTKLDIGLSGTATVCPREERRERKGRAGATSLSQISVRVVCLCVPVFIIGPTVPKGAGNDICSGNLSCLLARSNSCHGL